MSAQDSMRIEVLTGNNKHAHTRAVKPIDIGGKPNQWGDLFSFNTGGKWWRICRAGGFKNPRQNTVSSKRKRDNYSYTNQMPHII